ncbi:unnamed protein product [Bathycoccus prasinos]
MPFACLLPRKQTHAFPFFISLVVTFGSSNRFTSNDALFSFASSEVSPIMYVDAPPAEAAPSTFETISNASTSDFVSVKMCPGSIK